MIRMDHFKLSKINVNGIVISIAIGVIVAVGIYQAQVRRLPNQQNTQTIVKEENAIADVVEKASPSVVAIGVSRRVINPFDPFSAPQREDSTIGSGFVISDKGIIITNKHVVADPSGKYSVVTRDGQKFDVVKIYRDPILDLAIVQIDGSNLKALETGDSSRLKVGQTAIAIGNALGKYTNTVTTGVVSGLGRKVVAGDPFSGASESLDDLIQTDAAINPGNSGGPLLNSAGQVIGVNVATTQGAQNIGFAVPINTVKPILEQFLSKGTVSRAFLGVSYHFIAKDIALLNEFPQGAYIQDVVNGSPADKAGVKNGDIIIKIDGQRVTEESFISQAIQKKKTGETVNLEVWSDGKTRSLTVTLSDYPNQ